MSVSVLLFLAPSALPAQNQRDSLSSWDDVVFNDAVTVLCAGAHLVTSPLRWEGADWIRAGMTGAATGSAVLLDDEFLTVMHRNQRPLLNDLSDASELFGEAQILFVAASTTYLAGLFLEDTWIRETALLSGTAALYAMILTRVLKPVVGRARPFTGEGKGSFHHFSFSDRFNSFPSGHSVAAFSVATVLARQIDNVAVTIGLYTLASSTALSRVYTGQHWFSDVVFGGIMSTCLTHSLIDWFEGLPEQNTQAGFRIVPLGNGVRVAWVF
jgi:membrane-associated phospholipid phosphatase